MSVGIDIHYDILRHYNWGTHVVHVMQKSSWGPSHTEVLYLIAHVVHVIPWSSWGPDYIYWLVAYQNNIPHTSILDELNRPGVHNYHCKQYIYKHGSDHSKRFNSATVLCLSKTRIWISNVICHGFFLVQW
jgi:hypothetical protein